MAGSAAVGVRENGDDNVVAAGTFSDVLNPPVQAGSTVLETFAPEDLNVAVSLQGSVAQNPFSEVNIFIGEMANKMECAPRAAWERIRRVGDEIFRQSFS